MLKARGNMDTELGRAHLERLGLLLGGEWEAMVVGDRHTSVLCWIQAACVDLKRECSLCLISEAATDAAGARPATRGAVGSGSMSIGGRVPSLPTSPGPGPWSWKLTSRCPRTNPDPKLLNLHLE